MKDSTILKPNPNNNSLVNFPTVLNSVCKFVLTELGAKIAEETSIQVKNSKKQ